MQEWVRTIGFCIIQKIDSPFHALSDLSFYLHPENVLSPANTIYSSWYHTAFFSTVGAHLVSLVLRQYKVSVSNTTILQSYFYTRSTRMQQISHYHYKVWKADTAVHASKSSECPKACGSSIEPMVHPGFTQVKFLHFYYHCRFIWDQDSAPWVRKITERTRKTSRLKDKYLSSTALFPFP